MKGRKLSIIIVLMFASVIGIIGLQSYWVLNVIDEQSLEFDKRAKRALYATVKDLARSQAETIFITRFGEMLEVEEILKDVTMQLENTVVDRDTVLIIDGVRVNSVERTENLTVTSRDNVIVIETHSSLSSGQKNVLTEDRIGIKILEEAFHNVVVQEIAEEPNLKTRIGENNLSDILGRNLVQEGVELEFSYAVFSDSLVRDYSSVDEVDDNYYSATLFPESPNRASLYLGFPSKGLFVLQSMAGMLFFVLLFSLLLIGSFIYAVGYMLQQKRLSAMKSDFINNMTHEFKTPLATIGLAAESIIHPKVKTDEKALIRYSEVILQESKRLNYHVENILQLAKIERKELMLKKELVSFSDLVLNAIDTHKLMIEKRDADLVKIFCGEDVKVFADAHHLCNAISNLIDNALKYSFEKPEIAISVEVENAIVILTVTDKGSGMSSEAREKAFEAFYREESGDVHTVKGFGVGLSYVKEIVERHHGQVYLKSKAGRGTAVTIKIPQNES